MNIFAIGKFVEWGMQILKGLGIVKDPEAERAYQLKLLELAQSKEIAASQEFAAFLKATSPDPNRVYVWANTWIAITRPAITWLITGSIVLSFFIPNLSERMIKVVQAFDNRAGLLLLAIPLWWFFGRDIAKIFAARFGVNGATLTGTDELPIPGRKPAPPISTPSEETEAPKTYRTDVPLRETPLPERSSETPKSPVAPPEPAEAPTIKVSPEPPEWEPPSGGRFER